MAKSVAAVSNLPDHDTMVANILREYWASTPAEKAAGATWYQEAQEYAATLAAGTPYSMTQCAGVIAALSPQTEWGLNKRQAAECVRAHAAGVPVPSCNTGVQMGKVRAMLDGAMPQHVLHGPKERAFFGNITQDETLVTVDRWAFLTAVGVRMTDDNRGIGVGAFRRIAAAWHEAARILGITVFILQAICWVARKAR